MSHLWPYLPQGPQAAPSHHPIFRPSKHPSLVFVSGELGESFTSRSPSSRDLEMACATDAHAKSVNAESCQ